MADTFVPITFVPDELLTSTKMNQLSANQAAFHDGTGLGDGSIVARHMGLSNAYSGGVTTLANTGNAGGTMYYINLGGIKILWGKSAIVRVNRVPLEFIFTLPTSFFTSLDSVISTPNPLTVDINQNTNIASITTTFVGVYAWSENDDNATQQIKIFMIGR